MHAIITIGADGTLAVAGPYTSQALAERHADQLRKAEPGLDAQVHLMQPPRDLAEEIKEMRREP